MSHGGEPLPGQILIGLTELRKLLSLDKSGLYEFLKDPTHGFPKPVRIGTTRNGNARLRWKKASVLYWIESLMPHVEDPVAPENVRKRP